MFRFLTAHCLLAVMVVAGCAAKDEEYVERPVEEIYNRAMDSLQQDNFVASGTLFEEVERQHPYSKWATKSHFPPAPGCCIRKYSVYPASCVWESVMEPANGGLPTIASNPALPRATTSGNSTSQ